VTARRLRIAGIACGAAGVIAVGVGIGYRIHAGSLSDSASHGVYDQGTYDAGKRAEKMQWLWYGTGAAALATGAALYLYGWRPAPAKPAQLSLLPVVGPGAAGLAAQGAF
jgi:hypothetical protein